MKKQFTIGSYSLYSVEESNETPLRIFGHGRIGLYDKKHPSLPEFLLADLLNNFNALEAEINTKLIGMEEAVHVALLGLLTGDNVFILSKPGAAKSTLARIIAESIAGEFFRKNLTPDMSISDLVGPLSVNKINQGLYEREYSGLATASYAMLDEFYKSGKTIQNNVLDICEEHTITAPNRVIKVNILSIISASNELVDANARSATWDRWGYRIILDYPTGRKNLKRVMTAAADTVKSQILMDPDDIMLTQAYIEMKSMELPDFVLDPMLDILEKLNCGHIVPSPRRIRIWQRGIVAENMMSKFLALSNNKPLTQKDSQDMFVESLNVGRYILWIEPETREAVEQIVMMNSSEERSWIMKVRSDLEAIQNEYRNYDLTKLASAAGKTKGLGDLLNAHVNSDKYKDEKESLLTDIKNLRSEMIVYQADKKETEALNN